MTFVLPLHLKGARREFHVSRWAREHYGFSESLFSLHGSVLIADIETAQRVALRVNETRKAANYHVYFKAGDLYAAGLLDEMLHLVIELYREEINPTIIADARVNLTQVLGQKELAETLAAFASQFPPSSVYRGEQSLSDYLAGETDGVAHSDVLLEEMLMLWIANRNPALVPFNDFFDDSELRSNTAYGKVIRQLETFFSAQPKLDPEFGSLFDMLRAPALNADYLEAQLEFIRTRWAKVLGQKMERLVGRLLRSLSLLKEEQGRGGPGGPPPSNVINFYADDPAFKGRGVSRRQRVEYERFSVDQSWMPRVVMLAKSTYVWLDQLSRHYSRDISRLDQIPDEELDELARRGLNSLWLIGLWERSEASRRIKHLRGQPDAVASAYALYDYQIAHDLGGDAAYENLRDRAWQRGIRLASDMVPNHVGIDGRWVIEHPEWFLQLDHPPYPGYSFSGEDLSSDERIGIYLEDHYFDNSDAAVVFKRRDHWSGEERYIYHGNDGTTMPWNDTAQINYLNAEAREAVIQTILHVARKFPVIRFDAAMTLAKQHIQRLWFPEPGEGGAIPSRAQHGTMTAEELDRFIPQEFWREVVDRVAEEVPDTLLLAEAFWMMEGYFVRTLGMHRVYNSAFMHMFMQEENAKYRQSIKNTLEFDPDILKRFVNFMNNPDEETAVAQFGKDDKYFGVCIVMSTMPGLPMFGHGQIEGFSEKYGMEYRRAKWQEEPDSWLIGRHYHEVFPLLHRRKEFAEVENFLLYDVFTAGGVNENVFAYSNYFEGKGSLVLYNNTFADARGWIKHSAAYRDKASGELKRRELHDGLGVHGDDKHFVTLRDHIAGLEYLLPSRRLQQEGFAVELGAFKYQVLTDITEVYDEHGDYRLLYDMIGSDGVPSLEEERVFLSLKPLHEAFKAAFDAEELTDDLLLSLEQSMSVAGVSVKPLTKAKRTAIDKAFDKLSALEPTEVAPVLRLWQLVRAYFTKKELIKRVKDWRLETLLRRYFETRGVDNRALAALLPLIMTYESWLTVKTTGQSLLKKLLKDETVLRYLEVNEHDGIRWFNKEAFNTLTNALMAVATVKGADKKRLTSLTKELSEAEEVSGYKLDLLVKPKAKKAPTKKSAKTSSKSAKESSATKAKSKAPKAKASEKKAGKEKSSDKEAKPKSDKPKS